MRLENYMIKFSVGAVFAIFLLILRIRTLKRTPTILEWLIFVVFFLLIIAIFIFLK